MQLTARKITANTRDTSALIAVSSRAGGKKICFSQAVNYRERQETMSRIARKVLFHDTILKTLRL